MTQRTLCSISEDKERAIDMCNYILSLLTDKPKVNGRMVQLTERTRQFMTWGATDLQPIANTDGEVGLELSVSDSSTRARCVYGTRSATCLTWN